MKANNTECTTADKKAEPMCSCSSLKTEMWREREKKSKGNCFAW